MRGGTKTAFDVEKMIELLAQGKTKQEVADELGCSRNTVYHALKAYDKRKELETIRAVYEKTHDMDFKKRKRGGKNLTEEEREAAKQERIELYQKHIEAFDTPSVTTDEIGMLIQGALKWYQLGQYSPILTDKQCSERIEMYFKYFNEHGDENNRPSIEKLALAVGVDTRTLRNWKVGKGCSALRQEMISQAFAVHAAIDSDLAMTGHMDRVVWIFRSKNYADMEDNTSVTYTHETKQIASEEELRKRIMDGVIIDGDYEDVEGD